VAISKATSKPKTTPPASSTSKTNTSTAARAKAAQLSRTRRTLQRTLTSDQLSAQRLREKERSNLKAFTANGVDPATKSKAPDKPAFGLTKGVGSSIGSAAGAFAGSTVAGSVCPVPTPRPTPLSAQGQTDGPPPGYAGDDNEEMDLQRVAEVMHENLDVLDSAAGGRRDGKFGLEDMQAVAADSNAPEELREACKRALADPTMLNALDVAGGPRVDRVFSDKDLTRVIAEEKQNPDSPSLEWVAEQIGKKENFKALDSAKNGKEDDRISREDLEIVAADESADPDLRKAAQALLDNDNLFNALDVASRDSRDGKISKDDVDNVNYNPTPEGGAQWTDGDAQALDRALEDGKSFDNLYGAFNQTDRGNCASTAVIKAAMDRYGSDVFDSVKQLEDGGYEVKLQDGETVRLTREEMEAAATAAHYDGDDPEAKAMATLCYATMAKRAQDMGHEGAETYSEALLSLGNGEVTKNVPEYLGLADKVVKIDVDDIEGRSGVVGHGNGHAVYIDTVEDHDTLDDGTYTDAWGDPHEFDGTNETSREENELTGAYYFE